MKPIYRLVGLLLFAAGTLQAADWPQWRGPSRDGVAAEPPKEWPKSLSLKWKVEVGEGHSGPVLADQRVFTLTRAGDKEVVRCSNLADGTSIWSDTNTANVELDAAVGWHGNIPRSTPCVADGRVYTFGVGGLLTCYTADAGRRVWRHGFAMRFAKPYPIFGATTSPIVLDGMCIVWAGGRDSGALTALDAITGKEKWTLGIDGPGYASPILTELGGRKQLVTQSEHYLLGVDPASGKELWKVKFTTGYDQNSVTPLVVDDLLIYSGFQKSLFAASLTRAGDDYKLTESWAVRRQPLYMNSPITTNGRIFGFSATDGGTLFAVHVRDGAVAWKNGGMGEHASLIRAGEFVLAQTTPGTLHVLKGDVATYAPVAEYKVADENTWAHPALAGDVLLVKDKSSLYCWHVKSPES